MVIACVSSLGWAVVWIKEKDDSEEIMGADIIKSKRMIIFKVFDVSIMSNGSRTGQHNYCPKKQYGFGTRISAKA